MAQLISGGNKKQSAFLQQLKETGTRSGEAWRLKWINIDFKAKAIVSNDPEKHGKPRSFKINSCLISMLNALPKKADYVFEGSLYVFRRTFRRYRKRMAQKLQNPRLDRITFHTFSHWKTTTEFHRTKNTLHVMEMLGHHDIKSTLIYTQLANFESDEYLAYYLSTGLMDPLRLVWG